MHTRKMCVRKLEKGGELQRSLLHPVASSAQKQARAYWYFLLMVSMAPSFTMACRVALSLSMVA